MLALGSPFRESGCLASTMLLVLQYWSGSFGNCASATRRRGFRMEYLQNRIAECSFVNSHQECMSGL